MAEVQARLQALSEEYQKLQQGKFVCHRCFLDDKFLLMTSSELQETVGSRQKLQSQQQENAGVFKVGFFFSSQNSAMLTGRIGV